MSETMTTELEAVNTMLNCIGEAPINTLLGDLPAGIQVAVDLLYKTSRKVQKSGWQFNTEENFIFSTDINGNIALPPNALQVRLTVLSGSVDVVQRGQALYDRKNNTYKFSAAQKCTVVWFLDWDSLPEAARDYITVKAARILQDTTVGSSEHHRFSAQDELEAFNYMNVTNGENEQATIFDNFDMASIVMRKRPRVVMFPN